MSDYENLHARIAQLVERNTALGREVDRLNGENASLRGIAEELLRSVDCNHVHHRKADQHEHDEPCKVILRIQAALNRSPENPS